MSIVLAVANYKGGSGKTTTAVTVGSYFAMRRNWRVLIIDMDVQAHVDLWLGMRGADDIFQESGLLKLLLQKRPVSEVVRSARNNLDIIPNSFEAKDLDQDIMRLKGRELLLRDRIAGHTYDLVILDTPPAYSNIGLVALCAADFCIIPTKTEFGDLTGVNSVLEILGQLKASNAPTPTVIGALPTMYDRRTTDGRDNYDEMVVALRERGLQTLPPIPDDVKLKSCVTVGKTIWEHAPMSRGVTGFDAPLKHVEIPSSLDRYGGYFHVVEILDHVFKRRGASQA